MKNPIDKYSKQRKKLIATRDNALRAMRQRNADRGNQIQALENAGQKDYEQTMSYITRLNRKIDRVIKNITSEKDYNVEVAQDETKEYTQDKYDQAKEPPKTFTADDVAEVNSKLKIKEKTCKK